jgi:hypothetical protein
VSTKKLIEQMLNQQNEPEPPTPVATDEANEPAKIRHTRKKKDFFKTNIIVRDKYHVKLKSLAAKRGKYVWELLDEALKQYLDQK